MNNNEILADFQNLGIRVTKLLLDTRLIDERRGQVDVSFDFDYKIDEVEEDETQFLGILDLIVKVKAKVKKKLLFKIELEMTGLFAGNKEKLSLEKFTEMLEVNGLITVLPICRAYLVGVTSQSGIHPPVQIPMINVLKMREAKAKLSESDNE